MFAQTRTQRNNDAGYQNANRGRQYGLNAPRGRGQYGGAVVPHDEFGHPYESHFSAPVVFTQLDNTVKRFTEAQVYAQAGMVIRSNKGLRASVAIFPPDSYDGFSKELTYTLAEMSAKVARLVATCRIERPRYDSES